MNYPKVSMVTVAAELNRLHLGIGAKLRSSVEDAIRIGELLANVRGSPDMKHGVFLPWVKANCEFSEDTAERYRKLYAHADKIRTVRNLQEAYKKIGQIETAEKQSEAQKAKGRVAEYQKTGEKPEGWRRGTDDKLAKKEKDRLARLDEAKDRVRAESRERDEKDSFDAAEDALLEEATERFVETAEKRQGFKERIKLSQAGESDSFIDALMDYLEELDSDSRRIEACQNIIKVCRNVAAELQQ